VPTPVLLGLAAAVLVALGSWRTSLWFDEAVTASAAQRSLGDLGAMVRQVDAVHGLYYLLMHGWTEVAGQSAFALRLPSALAVGGATAGVYVLTRRLVDARVALLAAVVLVLLPRVTWMGMEARSTALAALLAVWMTWFVVRAVDLGRARWWVAYGALTAVGVALNIYVALLLAAHAVSLLLRVRSLRTWGAWGASALAGLVVAAPVVVESRAQAGQLGGVELPLLQMVRSVVVNQWFLGATPSADADGGAPQAGLGAGDLASTPWLLAAVLLAVLSWGLVVLGALPARGERRLPEHVVWAAPWLVVPSVLALAYTVVATPIYHPRYLAFCAPAVALLAGAGIARLRRRGARVAVVVTVVVLSLVVALSQRGPFSKSGYDWAFTAGVVDEHRQPGDAVYYGPRTVPEGDVVRKSQRLVASAYPHAFDGLTDVTLHEPAGPAAWIMGTSVPLADRSTALRDVDRLWVLRWDDYPAAAVADEDATLARAGLVPQREWHESITRLTLYARTP
jgi:mannosyltransferase